MGEEKELEREDKVEVQGKEYRRKMQHKESKTRNRESRITWREEGDKIGSK